MDIKLKLKIELWLANHSDFETGLSLMQVATKAKEHYTRAIARKGKKRGLETVYYELRKVARSEKIPFDFGGNHFGPVATNFTTIGSIEDISGSGSSDSSEKKK